MSSIRLRRLRWQPEQLQIETRMQPCVRKSQKTPSRQAITPNYLSVVSCTKIYWFATSKKRIWFVYFRYWSETREEVEYHRSGAFSYLNQLKIINSIKTYLAGRSITRLCLHTYVKTCLNSVLCTLLLELMSFVQLAFGQIGSARFEARLLVCFVAQLVESLPWKPGRWGFDASRSRSFDYLNQLKDKIHQNVFRNHNIGRSTSRHVPLFMLRVVFGVLLSPVLVEG